MNLYEAIFTRKTVKKFLPEKLSEEELAGILAHYRELPGLFGNIHTEMRIIKEDDKVRRFSPTGVKAPQYLAFYSEESPRYHMNMGALMQHMALYLCTLGLGSCFLDPSVLRKGAQQAEPGKKLLGLIAFGKSRGSHLHKRGEEHRLPLNELCVFKEVPRQWMKQLLEAARMAPSEGNSQPWRFVVYDNRIHIFTKKHQVDRFSRYQIEEQNFGGMLANILVAADELWLDVDLIRLENISQKNFSKSQYVLSAVMKS